MLNGVQCTVVVAQLTRGHLGGGGGQPLPVVILAVHSGTGDEISETEGVGHVNLVKQLHEVVNVRAVENLEKEWGGWG